jgi:crossover junction endodeoxyribonuclease RuvC
LASQANSVTITRRKRPIKAVTRKAVEKPVDAVDKLIKRNFAPNPAKPPRPLAIGVDPGLHGALVVVDLDTSRIVDVIDMPLYQKPSDSRAQGYLEFLDVHKLSSLIDMYAPMVAIAVLEEPGSMPEQGLESTFRFGRVCGQIHGILAGHYIPTVTIRPGVWKSALALSSNKTDSLLRANIEYPEHRDLWSLKKHSDRAEAALMVVYAKKYLSQMIALSRR